MNMNEGMTDRIIRVIAGLIILGMTFYYFEGNLRWLGLIGLVPLVTGIIGTCPVYSLLGMNTCPVKKA
jgi:Protein of unknown function (DUF2892)